MSGVNVSPSASLTTKSLLVRFTPSEACKKGNSNIIILGLVSRTLGQAVDIEVDFSEGIGRAPRSVRIVKTLGDVNKDTIMRIVKGVDAGPEFVKDLTVKLQLFFQEKEKMKQLKNK